MFSVDNIALVLTWRLDPNLGAVNAANDIWEAIFLIECALVLISFRLRGERYPVVYRVGVAIEQSGQPGICA